MWATPFEGRSPAHPAADRFWRASTDLGMVAVLHIGNTPAHFAGGWADAGWDEPDGAGMAGLLRFANSQRTEARADVPRRAPVRWHVHAGIPA